MVIGVSCVINMDRVRVLGSLLSELGFDGIVRFDLKEPEYKALNRLFSDGVSPKILGLVSIVAGSIDYQLGAGGAERFWSSLVESYSEIGDIKELKDVKSLFYLFISKPINRRLNNQKTRRIEKLLNESFSRWYLNNYENLINRPVVVWSVLASSLNTGMEKKTIVFAMKAWDISHLICYGDYLDFPWTIPIPVDYHVRNISLSSGIIELCKNDDMFRRVWHEVLKIVRENINKHITLLRVDSLVWQSGKIISENKFNKSPAYRGTI